MNSLSALLRSRYMLCIFIIFIYNMQKLPVKHIYFSRLRARIFLMFSIFFSIRHMLAAKQSSSAILFASDSPATVQPYSGGAFFMTSLCFLYTFFIYLCVFIYILNIVLKALYDFFYRRVIGIHPEPCAKR